MRTKYQTVFISRNEPEREFELTFEISPERHFHIITEVQVYDRGRDIYLRINHFHDSQNPWRGMADSILDYISFSIEIQPHPTGAAISIIEKIITIIHNIRNLQPCK